MFVLKYTAIGGILLALVACGDSDLERGATGAAVGAVAAEALGENVIVGATVGAAVGVLSDDLTR